MSLINCLYLRAKRIAVVLLDIIRRLDLILDTNVVLCGVYDL